MLGTVELVVAALIVRPWRLKRLWLRLLIAFALLLLWSVPWMLSAMHQPPVQGMHLLWLLLLDVGLLALCMVSAVSAWRAFRRRGRADAPRCSTGLLPELHPHMLAEARLGLAIELQHALHHLTPRPASSGRRACANTGLMRTTRAGGSVLAFSAPSLSGTTVALMPTARHRRRPR